MYKLVRFYCSLMWYVCMVFLHFFKVKSWSVSEVLWIHTPPWIHAHPFKSWNMRGNIMTTCFNETSMMNSSLINHNNPVLRALPFIQATAEVILHNYSKLTVFERGPWKRPIVSFCISRLAGAKFISIKSIVILNI